jgi:hypothetical protein
VIQWPHKRDCFAQMAGCLSFRRHWGFRHDADANLPFTTVPVPSG